MQLSSPGFEDGFGTQQTALDSDSIAETTEGGRHSASRLWGPPWVMASRVELAEAIELGVVEPRWCAPSLIQDFCRREQPELSASRWGMLKWISGNVIRIGCPLTHAYIMCSNVWTCCCETTRTSTDLMTYCIRAIHGTYTICVLHVA